MPKQVIVIMQQNYPFGQCEQITSQNTRVLVRKIYEVSVQQRGKLLQKVNILRRLRNEHMIKIESVLQQEESVHFLFEYIPIKLETWISNINDQFIENFRDQLIKFSAFLANNYIKIDFQLKNIGMDQNYGAKYFLDLDFTLDTAINREKLKSMYIREITSLFKPYIVSTGNSNDSNNHALDSERQKTNQYKNLKQTSQKNTPQVRKVTDTAISPPTNRNNTNNNASKNKEKALAQYYQDVNMSVDSENQKILQEFMDVLDNQGEQQAKNHPPPPPTMAKPQAQPQTQQRHQPPQFAKQPSQAVSSSQTYNAPQNSSFNQGSSNQQYGQQPSSSRQIQSNNYPPEMPYPYKNDQFSSHNSITLPSQAQTARATNNTSQSMGRGKSEIKEPAQMEMWRESADLQNRVKNAIQKSMSVIKKFKAIKENSQT